MSRSLGLGQVLERLERAGQFVVGQVVTGQLAGEKFLVAGQIKQTVAAARANDGDPLRFEDVVEMTNAHGE